MIPELQSPPSILRISPEVDVPITPRVRRLIDTAAFRRLSRISQLGLVALVYPGATHSRFEHSLGVYRNAIDFLRQLSHERVAPRVFSDRDASLFVVSGLLHDLGHWPYCHAIEDMKLVDLPKHEVLAERMIHHREIADCLRMDWELEPDDVARFLHPEPAEQLSESHSILRSMLSGPIDIDKLDYLERDSLHAGVPYGRNFDRTRLVHSLCVDTHRNRLSISEKGRTAAEMMVFARYVMFSEVYWHHAVRSATAMLQRAVYELRDREELVDAWLGMDESTMQESLMEASRGKSFEPCVFGLFGMRRALFKRIAQFDRLSDPELHRALARRPYDEIVAIARELARQIQPSITTPIGPNDLLIDTPPIKLEVQFDLQVRMPDGSFRALSELSPVVQALATRQFDEMVKRVRIFVAPHLREAFRHLDVRPILAQLVHHHP
ncbi:MAG: HD domain-containing protein [Pirellula sp.]|jgi:HD superfamily phosphohydrolase|nr:HD domain-containing protein [Pirellula sp.]